MADGIWEKLGTFPVNEAHLRANRVIAAHREDPAFSAFDVLRTRMTQALRENGWRRVAVTSPTPDCGKTFVCANLAITLSRYDNTRTVLMDMDMRQSSLHKVIGYDRPGRMGDYLRGLIPTERHFRVPEVNALNIGQNLALAFNGKREEFPAELLQDPLTEEVLEVMEEDLEPDVVLFDLPPALTHDDVIAFKSQFDTVLLVAGGGTTTAEELKHTQRNIGPDMPILGVVLNKADGVSLADGYY